MRVVAVFCLIAVAGCSGHDLATPSGKLFVMNAGQWTPTPADLVVPTRPGL